MRWLALLYIPLFGAAMVAALRHVDAAMGFKHSQARLDALAERRQKIERQWEVEATIVRRLLSANRVESPAKLREVYKERAKALEARNTAQKALEAERQASRVDEIAARQREVGQQISALEAELGNAAGMMMSAQEMSRRIKALSEKLHRIESGGPARAQAPAAEPPSAPAGEDTSAEGAERCERLIKLAEDLFLVDAEQLAASLGPRMGQFLAALSGKRFTGLTFDTRGTVELTAAGGATVALAGLPLADLDLVFLAIRVALLEGFSKQQPLPVFLDDPFGHLPEPFIDLNGRLLASLGRATQVVLFSRHTEYSQHATASFAL